MIIVSYKKSVPEEIQVEHAIAPGSILTLGHEKPEHHNLSTSSLAIAEVTILGWRSSSEKGEKIPVLDERM